MATGAGIEALTEQVNKVTEGLEKLTAGNSIVTIKAEGPGIVQTILLAAAIVACFATWPAMVVLYQLHTSDVKRLEDAQRDIQAWQQVMRNDIAKLKSDGEKKK